jgi:uncharacterized membrane protein SpoIIM required for sporulation
MVLESLLNPLDAEKRPWEMFFIGILYSSIAILIGLMIFGEDASLVIVFLTVLACIPIIYGAIKLEENKDMVINSEQKLIKEHFKALSFFMFLFFGIVFSCIAWYVFSPPTLSQNIFLSQIKTIKTINSGITGNFLESLSIFSSIFFNNIKVLLFCLLFSFLYGVGAIFILVWNASVLGAAVGDFTRTSISEIFSATGNVSLYHYFNIISIGVLRYSIHGIPEILAYFIAGLAGGIISVAIIRHDFRSEKFKIVAIDSMDLMILSVICIFIAALLEVYVTPVLFA